MTDESRVVRFSSIDVYPKSRPFWRKMLYTPVVLFRYFTSDGH